MHAVARLSKHTGSAAPRMSPDENYVPWVTVMCRCIGCSKCTSLAGGGRGFHRRSQYLLLNFCCECKNTLKIKYVKIEIKLFKEHNYNYVKQISIHRSMPVGKKYIYGLTSAFEGRGYAFFSLVCFPGLLHEQIVQAVLTLPGNVGL